jgi:hypothetical protein
LRLRAPKAAMCWCLRCDLGKKCLNVRLLCLWWTTRGLGVSHLSGGGAGKKTEYLL